jgi:hypothetical protein
MSLSADRDELDQIRLPGSANADRLRRRLTDALSLNRIALSELALPKVAPAWLRRLGETLRDYPRLIVIASDAIKAAADVADWAHHRWAEFEAKLFSVTTETLRLIAADLANFSVNLKNSNKITKKLSEKQSNDNSAKFAIIIDAEYLYSLNAIKTIDFVKFFHNLRASFGQDSYIQSHIKGYDDHRSNKRIAELRDSGSLVYEDPVESKFANSFYNIVSNHIKFISNKFTNIVLIIGSDRYYPIISEIKPNKTIILVTDKNNMPIDSFRISDQVMEIDTFITGN